jgi:hypothetical protein
LSFSSASVPIRWPQSPQWTSQLSDLASSIEKLFPPHSAHASSTLIRAVVLALLPVALQHLLGLAHEPLSLFDAPSKRCLVFLDLVRLASIQFIALSLVPHGLLSLKLLRRRHFPTSALVVKMSGFAAQVTLDCIDRVSNLIDGALKILARNAEPLRPVANLVLLAHGDARAVLRAAQAGVIGHARSPVLREKRL